MNRLLFGDNLKWLRDTRIFPDASVDLVYLDPPFNSSTSAAHAAGRRANFFTGKWLLWSRSDDGD